MLALDAAASHQISQYFDCQFSQLMMEARFI